VIDDSCDWRFRLFNWDAQVTKGSGQSGTGDQFAWFPSTRPFPACNQAMGYNAIGSIVGQRASGFGQSFAGDGGASNKAVVAYLAAGGNISVPPMIASTAVTLYVDLDDGKLKLSITGAPEAAFFLWIDASGQFSNA
jgi:hypothetical protein